MNEADVLEKYKLETLCGADLSGASFLGVNLSWANLAGANLSSACLSKADLSGANLSGANLCGASVSGANFSGAYLPGANLSGANLCKASFSFANLSGADLMGANLSLSDLSRANLSRADLSWSNLSLADLSNANLSGANFPGVDLSGANFLGVVGLASMKKEMEMLILLGEAIKQNSFTFEMGEWHEGDEGCYPDESSFESFLSTCGATHNGAGFCQVKLAEEGNPLALVSASVAGSHAIPSMAWLFSASKEEFVAYLDKLISGECPLLQR